MGGIACLPLSLEVIRIVRVDGIQLFVKLHRPAAVIIHHPAGLIDLRHGAADRLGVGIPPGPLRSRRSTPAARSQA